MSGHTPSPGPWYIAQEDGQWVVRAANYDAVCRLYAGGNGDLIAAAPDLLEACRAVLLARIVCPEDMSAEVELVRAAIAKAEGK